MLSSSASPDTWSGTFITKRCYPHAVAANGQPAAGVAHSPGGGLSDGELVAELSANEQLMVLWIRWQKRLLDASTKAK